MDTDPQIADPIEVEARDMGWVPQEEWRGPEESWKPAEEYVRRGKEILPILNKNNERLRGEVGKLTGELAQLRAQLAEAGESTKALEQFYKDSLKEKQEQIRQELIAQMAEAREEGNVRREIELGDQLAQVRALPEAPAKPAPIAPGPTIDPELVDWMGQPENSWFNKDIRKTSLAMGIAQEMRQNPANATLQGKRFYSAVAAEVEKILNPGAPSKVDGGTRPQPGAAAGGATRVKSFADLPADAKEACDKQGLKLVGPNKAFKDQAAWRNHYAKIFFEE